MDKHTVSVIMTKPNLSVLIDTYNHERYIEQAVVSAIEQDCDPAEYEIVVVDDGSTDRTAEIVRKFVPRVRLLSKKNGGQASAFNAGFAETHGRLVAFLDGDDWWEKGKLRAVVDAFEREPQRAAVSHAYYEVRGNGSEKIFHGPREEEILNLSTPEAAGMARDHWHFLLPCALTVRREVLEKVIPIPERLVFSADGPIATAAMAVGIRILTEPLAYYRVHSGNLNAVDERDLVKTRRKYKIGAAMFEIVEEMLLKQGVAAENVAALLDRPKVHASRMILGSFGGSRLKAFETEMRSFRSEYKNPTLSYRLFKYVVVGAASLLFPPKQFYKIRDWYTQHDLRRVRDQLAKSR
jgi:glycosyltransferase involved in cell wall biosynthesis